MHLRQALGIQPAVGHQPGPVRRGGVGGRAHQMRLNAQRVTLLQGLQGLGCQMAVRIVHLVKVQQHMRQALGHAARLGALAQAQQALARQQVRRDKRGDEGAQRHGKQYTSVL